MSLGLNEPWLFAGLLLLLVAYALRLRALRRRRAFSALTMCLGFLFASAALAGLHLRSATDRRAVLYVLDRSDSVAREEGAAREAIVRADAERRGADIAGLVVFGQDAATEAFPHRAPDLQRRRARINGRGSDIEGAIRRALADLPAGYAGRMLLASDGLATLGDAPAAARAAAARGVPIDVLPMRRAPSPEMEVVEVRTPPSAQLGEPIFVRVVAESTAASSATLEVLRDGNVIARRRVRFEAGAQEVFVARDVSDQSGMRAYEARLIPDRADDDGGAANNASTAFTDVRGAGRVLVITSDGRSAGAAAFGRDRALVQRSPGGAPAGLAEWSAFDLVVLDDVSARSFSDSQMRDLRAYVRDLGGGLLMTGARNAFGLGGYVRTPVEEALPARFDLRSRQDRLSLGMVIAIDRSGSMGAPVAGRGVKLDLANEGAAQSVMMLAAEDRIGIVHVDTSPHWTQPMTFAGERNAVASAARRAQPGGGGIYVRTAFEAAFGALRRERVQLKHVLLFSDGNDSVELGGTREMVSAARRSGITTSIVSMGRGSDSPELEVLSRLGGGRFYIVDDLSELPRIFTQETMEASQAALDEEAFRPVAVEPGPATRGLDLTNGPALLGHAIVRARPSAVVELAAGEDPSEALVAWWRFGLGKGAVFTTDLGREFGRPWAGRPEFATMLDQLARLLRRRAASAGRVRMVIDEGEGSVVVEAGDEQLFPEAVVTTPSGERVEVAFEGEGGRFEARFAAQEPGAYWVTAIDRQEGTVVGNAGAMARDRAELRGEGTDYGALQRIATLSGGRMLEDAAQVHASDVNAIIARQSLESELVVLALLCLVLSVAARRLPAFPAFSFFAAPTRDVDKSPDVDRSQRDPERERGAEPAEAEEPDETQDEGPASLAEKLLQGRRRR